jgi:glutamine amidotransferase-like uncharacterized protein/N-formylglutamate amidohydrolase
MFIPLLRFDCLKLFIILCSLHANDWVWSQEKTQSAASVSEVGNWIEVQTGELPIVLSAPHGGSLELPGIPERKGEGMATGGAGFFTGRDGGTEELAREVSNAIESRFGKLPFMVLSKVHRRYLDPNRPPEIAFEDPRVKPVYEHYHSTLAAYCRQVTERFQAGVLIDIHGQGSKRDTVFRGTKNGLTVTRLRKAFGEESHVGANSLFGLLNSRGWTVHPTPLDDKEQSGYTGGYIVQTYGSHQALPIDAMQLEFGAEYRVPSRRALTAEVLADSLAEYATAYLKIRVPERSTPLSKFDRRRVHVAVFVDEGVSSTEKLFSVLESDNRLVASKVTANDVRNGKLEDYAVLIHPGGSGGGQGRTLGEEGRNRIREFIKAGNGYVGICAGAYLATCDYDWSLNVLDAKVIDRKHWNRGTGNVSLAMSPVGKETLNISTDAAELYYHQGPLLAPAQDPTVPDFQSLATYDGEIVKNGAPEGVMRGTTAIASGEYGKGRVICFSPHPEKTPNLEHLLLQGIQWAASSR